MRLCWLSGASAAALSLVLAATVGASGARILPAPGVRANEAWISETSGPTDPSKAVPQLFIVTRTPARPRPHLPVAIFGGLDQLAPNGALVWASTASRGHYDHFRYDTWPPRLSHFRIDHAWEGQPQARIQQRLLWLTADGWSLDVRVYFGTQHPPQALLAAVQAELDRLSLPRG
jgi:hypothetical protein